MRFVDNDEFLKPEVRDGWEITAEMKKVWAVQLDLLQAFIDVCSSNCLKYWVIGGTLLGVVRHKGYIPWDDDLDVCMPREDYEELLRHPEYFSLPIQFHVADNKENYYEGWVRLHNVNTSCYYPSKPKDIYKQGIYIDIFPLDGVKKEAQVRNDMSSIRRLNAIGHACTYNVNPNKALRLLSTTNKIIHLIKPEKLWKRVNTIAKSENHLSCDYWGIKVVPVYTYKKMVFRKSDFEKTKTFQFEGLSVCAPAGYDRILKNWYGDYMQFPPQEERGIWHIYKFDADKSYQDLK